MQRAMRKFDGAEFFDRKLKLIDVSMFFFFYDTDVEKIWNQFKKHLRVKKFLTKSDAGCCTFILGIIRFRVLKIGSSDNYCPV